MFRYGSALAQLEEQLLLACAAHEDVATVGECHVAGSHGSGGEISVGGVADLAAPGGLQQTHLFQLLASLAAHAGAPHYTWHKVSPRTSNPSPGTRRTASAATSVRERVQEPFHLPHVLEDVVGSGRPSSHLRVLDATDE